MRIVSGAVRTFIAAAAMAVTAGLAQAADDEGKITKVNAEALTITLENGNTYKLSAEFDVEALQPGMEVVLAYDMIGDEKMVTDLVTYE